MKYNRDQTILIRPGKIGFTTSTSLKYNIGTYGLTTCVGLAIYDPILKVGGVAHVQFNVSARYLEKLLLGNYTNHEDLFSFDYSQFMDDAFALFNLVNLVGGKRYQVYTFNVDDRDTPDSKDIKKVIDRTFSMLESQILSHQSRNETDFKLDIRNGVIEKI